MKLNRDLRNLVVIFLFIVVIFSFITNLNTFAVGGALAGTTQQTLQEKSESSETTKIEKRAEVLRLKTLSRRDLETRVVTIGAEIIDLEKEVIELEANKTELESQISNLEKSIQEVEELENTSDNEEITEKKVENTEQYKTELQNAKLDLVAVNTLLKQKQTELQASKELLEEANKLLNEAQAQVTAEEANLRNEVLEAAKEIFINISYFIVYFIVFLIVNWLINKTIKNPTANFAFKLILRLVFFVVSTITLVILFAGNLSALVTVLSFASAALVVALQDFVSSFFAWIFIRTKNKYKAGDIIKVAGSQGYFFGKVLKVEIFRTLIQERMGDGNYNGNINKEQPTGKVISLPNNIIMKEPVVNFTLFNNILWQNTAITLTFDSDFELGEEVIRKTVLDFFNEEYLKENKIPRSYVPKVTINIESSGVQFTIWFPAKIGSFKETLHELSKNILKDLAKNKLELAYNTITLHNPKSN